jgi:NADH-quinone oxidoreductase subunit J
MALTMIILGVFYIAAGADFLGTIQILVYTGAVMMLFLFVIMLVGVDSSESLIETIKGQRWAALVLVPRPGWGARRRGRGRGHLPRLSVGVATTNATAGNVSGIAHLIFGRYVWVFEATSALLITAALGAMVLAHRERLGKGPEPARLERAPLPARGAPRRATCRCLVSTPATTRWTPRHCCPTAAIAELSVSRVLAARDQTLSPDGHIETEEAVRDEIESGSER